MLPLFTHHFPALRGNRKEKRGKEKQATRGRRKEGESAHHLLKISDFAMLIYLPTDCVLVGVK